MNFIDHVYNKISYRSRRRKRLLLLDEEFNKYLSMSESNLIMECIETKAKYEQKTITFTITSITIIISIVMGLWKYLFSILFGLFSLDDCSMDKGVDIAIILIVIIIVMLIVIAAIIIFDLTRNRYKLSKKVLILEESIKRRNKEFRTEG